MFKKLDDIKKRYQFLSEQLADSSVIADMGTWQKYSKEQSDLTETVEKYDEYLTVSREMEDAFALAEEETDQEMKKLLLDEGYACKEKLPAIVNELKILLLPAAEFQRCNRLNRSPRRPAAAESGKNF